MDPRDQDILDAFARRFSAIDSEIPPPPRLRPRGRGVRLVLGGVVAIVASLVVVAVTAMIVSRPVVIAPFGASPSVVAPTSPVPSSSASLPAGITRDEAIAIARRSTDFTTLVEATAGPVSEMNVPPGQLVTLAGAEPADLVWAVTFAGDITICPPPASWESPTTTCESPRPATRVVVLDYETGALLSTFTFSPHIDPSASPSLPPGITRDEAIAIASGRATLPDLIDATVGPIGEIPIADGHAAAATGLQPDALVWTVSFEQRPASCPQTTRCEAPGPGPEVVYLDDATGRILAEVEPMNGAQIVCTMSAESCSAVLTMVPADWLSGASLVVIADTCAPGWTCDRLHPFDAAVAIAHGTGEERRLTTFEVVGASGPERVVGSGELPDHVRALVGGG